MASSFQQVSILKSQWILCAVDITRGLKCTADPLTAWVDSSPREREYILVGAWWTKEGQGVEVFWCAYLSKIVVFEGRTQHSSGCTFVWQDNNGWEASPLSHLSGMIDPKEGERKWVTKKMINSKWKSLLASIIFFRLGNVGESFRQHVCGEESNGPTVADFTTYFLRLEFYPLTKNKTKKNNNNNNKKSMNK